MEVHSHAHTKKKKILNQAKELIALIQKEYLPE